MKSAVASTLSHSDGYIDLAGKGGHARFRQRARLPELRGAGKPHDHEDDGAIAGYLEASLQFPEDSARWQAQRDLLEIRLLINFVGTADAYKRQGVATKLVEAAEDWGRERGAVVAVCDTFIESPLSVPFWERRMGHKQRAIIFRKRLG